MHVDSHIKILHMFLMCLSVVFMFLLMTKREGSDDGVNTSKTKKQSTKVMWHREKKVTLLLFHRVSCILKRKKESQNSF